jgi:o-succinylbenzoate---CoA ligase
VEFPLSGKFILFNPRLPFYETEQVSRRLNSLVELPDHFWLATSGSTAQSKGEIKWVSLSIPAVLAAAQGVNTHLAVSETDFWLHALPFFHVGGLGILARAHLSGSKWKDALIVQKDGFRQWEPHHFYQRAVETEATLSALVPTQVYDLLKLGYKSPTTLRAIIVGGAALSVELYNEARASGWKLLPSYGLTECCAQVATASLSSLRSDKAVEQLPGLKILPHVQIRTEKNISGAPLQMRGSSLLSGYAFLREGGKPDVFVDPKVDGWYQSEDLGEIKSGSLVVAGRNTDFVKVGGESVDLTRLNGIFEKLKVDLKPNVDLVITAIPDSRLGHYIAGIYEGSHPECPVPVQEFFDQFNKMVLPFERVRSIHGIKKIPRSPLQKLLKAELLDELKL